MTGEQRPRFLQAVNLCVDVFYDCGEVHGVSVKRRAAPGDW
jgi:hypothetical protein